MKKVSDKNKFLSILIGALLIFMPDGVSAEKITISYLERPPYYYTQAGKAKGILIDPVRRLFEEAGVDYRMLALPPNRIMLEIQKPGNSHCSPGWFITPDRLKYAKFTLAYYQNKPLVILFHQRNAERIRKFQTVAGLFGDKSLVLGRVVTFKYGSYIDDLLAQHQPVQFMVNSSQKQLIQLLELNRISYVIISPEEVDSLVEQAHLNGNDFLKYSIPDIPAGNKRYLMCNQAVDDEIMQRFNQLIRKQVNSEVWKE